MTYNFISAAAGAPEYNTIVRIDGESTGLIVDSGDLQRVGFMKYNGYEAGLFSTAGINLRFGQITDGTLASPNTFAVYLIIDESGNVGVGTVEPGYKLHVAGTLGFTGIATGFTASQPFKIGGKRAQNFTTAGNSAGSLTQLVSHNFAANELESDGAHWELLAAGQFANTGSVDKQIVIKFNSVTLFDTGSLAITSGSDWVLRATLGRAGSSTCRACFTLQTSFASIATKTAYISDSGCDFTASGDFSLYTKGTNGNDVLFTMWDVKYYPAVP